MAGCARQSASWSGCREQGQQPVARAGSWSSRSRRRRAGWRWSDFSSVSRSSFSRRLPEGAEEVVGRVTTSLRQQLPRNTSPRLAMATIAPRSRRRLKHGLDPAWRRPAPVVGARRGRLRAPPPVRRSRPSEAAGRSRHELDVALVGRVPRGASSTNACTAGRRCSTWLGVNEREHQTAQAGVVGRIGQQHVVWPGPRTHPRRLTVVTKDAGRRVLDADAAAKTCGSRSTAWHSS